MDPPPSRGYNRRMAASSQSAAQPRHAVVTGASSGIGRAVAGELARRGFTLTLIARRESRLRELAEALPVRTAIDVVDLADPAAVDAACERLGRSELGPVDVLVNNAGYGENATVLALEEPDHRRLMQVNYFAPLALIRSVLPGMVERRRGHVINIASIATKFGPGGHGAYTAAKSALVALTQSLAVEHRGQGVHLSYVNPGLIRTEFFERPSYRALADAVARRALPAELAARHIVALLDRPRLEICVPRRYRFAGWITAMSPTWMARIVARESRVESPESDRAP